MLADFCVVLEPSRSLRQADSFKRVPARWISDTSQQGPHVHRADGVMSSRLLCRSPVWYTVPNRPRSEYLLFRTAKRVAGSSCLPPLASRSWGGGTLQTSDTQGGANVGQNSREVPSTAKTDWTSAAYLSPGSDGTLDSSCSPGHLANQHPAATTAPRCWRVS